MKAIPISKVKAIREDLGATHLVIFAIAENGQQHVATHGKTQANANEAAKAGNKLKVTLGWPGDLCTATPLERKCKNCDFYKPYYGIHCFNGWSQDGSHGFCLYEPKRTNTDQELKCSHFEPKC